MWVLRIREENVHTLECVDNGGEGQTFGWHFFLK